MPLKMAREFLIATYGAVSFRFTTKVNSDVSMKLISKLLISRSVTVTQNCLTVIFIFPA
jgi:hypothetical protein